MKRWNEFELYPWQRATLWDKTKSCHVGPECMLGSLPLHIRLSPLAHSFPVLRERRKGTRVCPAFLKVTLLPIISLQVRGHYRWAVNFHSPSQISLRNGVNCIFVLERKINKRSIPLPDSFWQISSPRFLFEPPGRAEAGLTCSLALAVPLRWQEPCLPRTAVSHSVTD